MLWLTIDATLVCSHENGNVRTTCSQDWLTITGRPVMVDPDPEGRTIVGCPNVGATIKPCLRTLAVRTGYSDLIRIDGKRVSLQTVVGLTDGTPPGTVEYHVRSPGQALVAQIG